MDPHSRQLAVNRIICGEYLSDHFSVVPLTPRESYQAERIYNQSKDLALASGALSEGEVNEYMLKYGLWTLAEQAKLDQGQKDLEKAKLDLYENRRQKASSTIRRVITSLQTEITRIYSRKHSLEDFTVEGYAFYCKSLYGFYTGLRDPDGNKILGDEASLPVDWWTEYRSCRLDQDDYWDIVRHEPFSSIWQSRESAGSGVFGKASTLLTEEQRNLCIWATTLDNVRSSDDCPEDMVLEDFLLFEGWMISQRNKRKKSEDEKRFNLDSPTIANSQMAFIFGDKDGNDLTHEDAQIIENFNDPTARMIKAQRWQTMQAKGTANMLDFTDVQLDVMAKTGATK